MMLRDLAFRELCGIRISRTAPRAALVTVCDHVVVGIKMHCGNASGWSTTYVGVAITRGFHKMVVSDKARGLFLEGWTWLLLRIPVCTNLGAVVGGGLPLRVEQHRCQS